MSMGRMPCSFICFTWPGSFRLPSMPPCTFGCSVFTRPSSISGKPVNSETSMTLTFASRSALAVPPVESISTPILRSFFANCTTPALSETEIRALCTLDMRFLRMKSLLSRLYHRQCIVTLAQVLLRGKPHVRGRDFPYVLHVLERVTAPIDYRKVTQRVCLPLCRLRVQQVRGLDVVYCARQVLGGY